MNAPLSIPKALQKRLEKVAAASRKKPEAVLKSVLETQLDYEEWFIREVEAGLAEAKHGELVANEKAMARLDLILAKHAPKKKKAA